MATSKISQVFFHEGEGIDLNDVNQAQMHLRSQIWDWIMMMLERSAGEAEVGNSLASRIYTIGNGGFPKVGGGTREVEVYGGLIACPDNGAGTPDGTEPYMVPYALAFDEITQVSGANVSGNPRYDILQVKIDYVPMTAVGVVPAAGEDPETRDFEDASVEPHTYSTESIGKRYNSRITASVKAGTPAGSPTEPSPDAGYVKMASWLVANGASAIVASEIRDYRFPVGVRTLRVNAVNGGHEPTYWTRSGGILASLTGDGNATVRELALIPSGGPVQSGRLLRIRMSADIVAASAAVVSLVRVDSTYGAATSIKTLTSSLITAGGGDLVREWDATSEAWWMNGYEAGTANNTAATQLGILFQTGTTKADQVHWVEFDVAGM